MEDSIVKNPSLPGAAGRLIASDGLGPETPRAARMAGGESRAIPPEVVQSIENQGLAGLAAAEGGQDKGKLLLAAGGLLVAAMVLKKTGALSGLGRTGGSRDRVVLAGIGAAQGAITGLFQGSANDLLRDFKGKGAGFDVMGMLISGMIPFTTGIVATWAITDKSLLGSLGYATAASITSSTAVALSGVGKSLGAAIGAGTGAATFSLLGGATSPASTMSGWR